ncbi:hypothetical protein Tco_0618578 [Tanacetum coccineum]
MVVVSLVNERVFVVVIMSVFMVVGMVLVVVKDLGSDDDDAIVIELSAEHALRVQISNPSLDSFDASPVKVDVHSELPKTRTTPSALTEGEWGFEHTKDVFIYDIIPFLKSLKDIFNVFDKDLLNEMTKVQTIFDQMEAAVQ